MKNQKGITLISLVLTIVLIFILGAVGVYTGVEAYKTMKIQKFIAQMKVIQERVNIICDDWKNWDKYDKSEPNNLEKYIVETLKQEKKDAPGTYDTPKKATALANPEFNEILTGDKTSLTANDLIISNYFYFSSEDLEKFLKIKDLDVEVIINFSSRNFVEKKGVESIDSEGKDKIYYVLDELVEAQRLTSTIIENQIKDEPISDYYKYLDTRISENLEASKKVLITLNVKVKTPIKSVYYSLKETSDPKTIPESEWTNIDFVDLGNYLEVLLDKNGDYHFKVIDNRENIFYSKNPINIELVNIPVLEIGMTPIYFQDGKIIKTTKEDRNWYNYDKDKKEWANVMLEDGSIYVWIPRFAYKINNVNESVDIKFLLDASDNLTIDGSTLETGYTVHPAFQSGITKADKYKNGEWENEVNGIWVSKFNATVSQKENETVLTTAFGKEMTKLKNFEDALKICREIESKELYGFTNVATGTLQNNLKFEQDENKIDTHLIKNSEIGAVMYLAWSDFGNARNELKNNNTDITGGSEVENDVFNVNVLLSTTGNASGIYDLLKKNGEYVSSGLEDVKTSLNIKEDISSYYTPYSNESDKNTIIGDGITDLITWENDKSENRYPNFLEDNVIFIRGNNINNFFSYSAVKLEETEGYYIRPVIIIEN